MTAQTACKVVVRRLREQDPPLLEGMYSCRFGETSLDVIEKVGFATRPVCRTCIAVSHPYGPAPLAGPPALQEPREATGVYVPCTGSRSCDGIRFFEVAKERVLGARDVPEKGPPAA